MLQENNFDAKTTISVTRLLGLDQDHGPVALLTDPEETVHLRQGDMDGACGPYALVMAMIAMGLVSYKEATTKLLAADRRTRFGRFAEALRDFGPLMAGGTTIEDVQSLTDFYKTTGLEAAVVTRKSDLDVAVSSTLDEGGLAIVGIDWRERGTGGHWLLAVGHQGRRLYSNKSYQLTHLLCLDPGQGVPKTSLWNSVIHLNDELGERVMSGKYSSNHWGLDGVVNKCYFAEAIILKRPKQIAEFFTAVDA